MLEGDGSPDAFAANIESYNNYYAFGMTMPGRSYNSPKYRYGYQGKEKLNEINGVSGSNYDFGARIYDVRLGRWLSVDPLAKLRPMDSPYSGMGNNPIQNIDSDGRKFGVNIWSLFNSLRFWESKTERSARQFAHDIGGKYRNEVNGKEVIQVFITDNNFLALDIKHAYADRMGIGMKDITYEELESLYTFEFKEGEDLSYLYDHSVQLANVAIPLAGEAALVMEEIIIVAGAASQHYIEGPGYDKLDIDNAAAKQILKTEEVGSYTNTHERGKYHGKGSRSRAEKSAKEKADLYEDPVIDIDWTPSSSDREAFKDESRRLENDGGHKNPDNYNQRDSPGTNYRKQDGE